MPQKTYLCIDLKSFYASVECADLGLDPFVDNLVVADPERSRTTICLAITPAMKARGVKNRCRVFDIPANMSYIMARPRMRRYMEVSAAIYAIYLRYVSPEDVHVYSIDECFIDATPYLSLYGMDARTFARTLMSAVFKETSICATAGVGTNLFLAKVALDITAKHAPDNIGFLDEAAFRREIWFHRPHHGHLGHRPRHFRAPGEARRARPGQHGSPEPPGPLPRVRRQCGIPHRPRVGSGAVHHRGNPRLRTGRPLPGQRPSAPWGLLVLGGAHGHARDGGTPAWLELVEKGLVTERISLSIGYARQAGALRGAETFEGGHGTRVIGPRAYGERTGASRKLERRTNSERLLMERFERLFDEVGPP